MPNWVKNKVRAVNKEDAAKLIAMLVKDGPHGKVTNFNGIIPMPEELLNTVDGTAPDHQKKMAENKAKYGYGSWYDFACNNWGTKWDNNIVTINGGVIEFETAWDYPEGIYRKISETIPIIVAYADEAIGFNYGIKEYHEDGESDIEIAGEDRAIANAIWGYTYDPDDECSNADDYDSEVQSEVDDIIYNR